MTHSNARHGADTLPSPYRLISALEPSHLVELQRLYEQEWWTKGRTPAQTAQVVEGSSLNLGITGGEGELVGYARVLTDYTIKALIFDVIVRKDHRGHQLGAYLMEAIVRHPSLSNVAHFELYCLPEMEPFYERWGFSSELGTLRFMRRKTG
ncbi:GNAT family N-acetyltransferase [Mesorhizobium comanense]|uniref:GNAT family N-acetyltransferase n=1 Tax=Mesorhizobium comanense TaxID=2502215 RepID=UPI0010F4F761|nr:GNAT family N-acetyltransferase [Mesorhizobium comanense]